MSWNQAAFTTLWTPAESAEALYPLESFAITASGSFGTGIVSFDDREGLERLMSDSDRLFLRIEPLLGFCLFCEELVHDVAECAQWDIAFGF